MKYDNQGKISNFEMSRTFNCGVGAVIVVDPRDEQQVLSMLNEAGANAAQVGSVVAGKGQSTAILLLHIWKCKFL